MSIAALCWAFEQELLPATRKLILIALADCANQDHCAFPSCETLQRKTSLDRKTILQGLADLQGFGYLLDTGKRVGKTKQIPIFKLNGLPDSCHHYVYRITNDATGEFYVGVRSSVVTPEEDPYLGSGRWPTKMLREKVRLLKTIVAMFSTRSEAETFETQSIQVVSNDPLCRNIVNNTETGTIPFFPSKSPVFPIKESRKRDTDPKEGTVSTDPKDLNTMYQIPILLNTPDFTAVWEEYAQHRKEKRSKLTSVAARNALRELEAMGVSRAIVAIRHTLAKGWTGIQEPNGFKTSQKNNLPDPNAVNGF